MTTPDQEDGIAASSISIGRVEQRRILFLSLEFTFSPFSGNGVLARSLVSSLMRRDDCAAARVICAKPHPSTESLSKDVCLDPGREGGDLEIWPVELPKHCQWKRLDRSGPWAEYSEFSLKYAPDVKEFQPTDVVAVDWHGMLAWKWIYQHLNRNENSPRMDRENISRGEASWVSSNVNVCYYNFRVYSSSLWEHWPSVVDEAESDDQFYRIQEQQSCRLANVVICLAENDRSMLQRLTDSSNESTMKKGEDDRSISFHVLHPPLRGDIRDLAIKNSGDRNGGCLPPEAKLAIEKVASHCSSKRMFITCMSRLSPEKSPHHFVSLLRKLGGVEFLRRHSLIPIMCGARSVEGYAQEVVDDFGSLCSVSAEGEAWPCVVIDHHLGPRELAAVFSHTVLNVHPCLYDAYGMTMVEAAAFGVVSVVNGGGKVGATALLGEGKGCIAVDLGKIIDESRDCGTQPFDIETISVALQENSMSLDELAIVARTKALGWDENACCQGLLEILKRDPMI